MVKRCGKSAPRSWQHGWQAKPRTEQGQIGRYPGDLEALSFNAFRPHGRDGPSLASGSVA